MSNASVRALEAFVRLTNTAAISHVVRASLETGVVDALRDSQKTMEEIAEISKVDIDRLRILLEALVAIGVVERYEEHFALAQVGHLVPVELADLGDRYWRHLNRWILEGVTIPDNEDSTLDENDYLRERHASEWLQTPAALKLAELLKIGQERSGIHLIDIGCGAAVMSLTAAFRDPTCRVTAFDTPVGLERAKETLSGIDLGDRVQLVEDHSNEYRLPDGPFDMALMSNVAHYLSSTRIQELMRESFEQLHAGGEMVIVDVFPGQPKGNLNRSLFELQLALRYPEGGLHSREDLTRWLIESGFDVEEFESLEAPPYLFGVLVGRKSASA